MFGIDDALIGAVAAPLIGGLLGGSGRSSSQTQQATIDPRIANYLYGTNGTSGLLGEAKSWYDQNKSGMSAPMTQAANAVWNQNNANHQGYDAMQGIGMGLLGGGVAGNPFAGGYTGGRDMSASLGGRGGSIAPTQMAFTPPTRAMTTDPFTPAAPTAAPVAPVSTSIPPEVQALIDEYKTRSGHRQYDNFNYGDYNFNPDR